MISFLSGFASGVSGQKNVTPAPAKYEKTADKVRNLEQLVHPLVKREVVGQNRPSPMMAMIQGDVEIHIEITVKDSGNGNGHVNSDNEVSVNEE